MSEERHSQGEAADVDDVVRLLAALADSDVSPPSADAIYWRAKARLALEDSSRRRRRAVSPLRLFHLALGVGAMALAAVASVWPLFIETPRVGFELLAPPLLIAVTAMGAYLLAESGPSLSSQPFRLRYSPAAWRRRR